MAPSYVDTSALLKLYVSEPGTAWIVGNVTLDDVTISELTTVEIGASLVRRFRDGDLDANQARKVWRRFRQDRRVFHVLSLNSSIMIRAVGIAARSPVPLRTLDAIQLQCAVEADRPGGRPGPLPLRFISADSRLIIAAQALGFFTENPLDHV